MLLIGLGLGFSFVPISVAALAGVDASEAGLALGLINTSQQIGDAVGIAAAFDDQHVPRSSRARQRVI